VASPKQEGAGVLDSFLKASPGGFDASEQLDRYYRLLNPKDIHGSYVFNYIDNGGSISAADRIYNNYLAGIKSGNTIIENLTSAPSPEDETLEGFGLLYNTVFQEKSQPKARYLDGKYWRPSYNFLTDPESSKLSTAVPDNFYSEVCGVDGTDGPPASFSINVLRGPTLSAARKNSSQIETFLNHMPSIFPSQMVPYMNIEFQFPVTVPPSDADDLRDTTLYSLQRPSLYRFLMGSEVKVGTNSVAGEFVLTAADLNLSYVVPTKAKPNRAQYDDYSYFSGMEMFTTPQTLTNMESLGEGPGRINPVKPFLPGASLTAASVAMLNAGAGSFVHKKADVTLKIHDKARLVEFSEFLRAAEGHRGLTVWLTYGWLAPRSHGDDDIYAKFINENMLVREAFMIKNNSFSFDASGQVEVKLELVSKGYKSIESETLNFADKKKSTFLELTNTLDRIKQNRSAFGMPPEGTGADVRIYQVLDSAVAGTLDPPMKPSEMAASIFAAKNVIQNRKGISKEDRRRALELLDDVAALYAQDPTTLETGKERPLAITKAKTAVSNFNSANFNKCSNFSSPDPFLPDLKKKIIPPNSSTLQNLFSEELVKSMNDSTGLTADQFRKSGGYKASSSSSSTSKGIPEKVPSTRTLVSFGKIFCIFCLPALLRAAQQDGIEEVQINFYQFNDACGPLSLHNIAEFPINLDDFKQQFLEMVVRRGGESMTVQEFMNFVCNTQFSDSRAPGYGMRSFYEPYDANKPEESKTDEADFSSKMAGWIAKWGGFKKPNIGIKMEVLNEDAAGKVDLLYKLQSHVGMNVKNVEPAGNQQKEKKIKRISIYDKQFSPHAKIQQRIVRGDGGFSVYEGPPPQEVLEKNNELFKSTASGKKYEDLESFFYKKTGTTTPVRRLASNKNILREFIRETVPTLTIGTNGSLIYNVNLASKTDGLLGTVNMQGGAYRSKATLSPNGLAMGEYSLPLRVVPASMSMTSLGCPIADVYQQYYIDLGTGTTIDNLYTVTQLIHNFTPGKFETNWTFTYTDGYGKFFGAHNIKDTLDKIINDAEPPPAESSPPAPPATSAAPGAPTNAKK